jgi:TRAP transporter TAXI family solute receptor
VGKSYYLSKDVMVLLLSPLVVGAAAFLLIFLFVAPAPPKHFVISTGEDGGNAYEYAQKYRDIIKAEGVDVEVRPSLGALDNLDKLIDPKSDVQVGFVQDGLGSRRKYRGLTSLGSMFYEPVWVFYRGARELNRLSQLAGKSILVGKEGGETFLMAKKMLKASGVDESDAKFVEMEIDDAAEALKWGRADAAFFMGTPGNKIIGDLLRSPKIRLMDMDQAEAIVRQLPYLHHLVLPHGSIDLARNIPERDTDLVAPTATLLVRDSLHPALVYLLLKAAARTHRKAGFFEGRHEFPSDKDYVFPLNAGAKSYYQSGAPFWLRYLPFWLATLVERFIFLVIPMAALIIPITRSIPRFLKWRLRARIYQRYGELKHLETRILEGGRPDKYEEYLEQLDSIEERVNRMRLPLDLSDYVYSLKGHIQFVRDRLRHLLGKSQRKGADLSNN